MWQNIKAFFLEVKFPKGWELFILILVLAVYMFGAAFVLNGDGSYGYSVVERMADSGAFADNDLAVMGTMNGSFLFYRLLYYMPFFQQNFVLVDFVLSSIVSVFLLLAWYNIFLLLSGKKKVAGAALVVLMFVGSRLSLGGTTIPLFYLTSISSVLFLQTFAFFFYLKKRPIFSFFLLSLTTYFHPPSGLFFMAVLGLDLFTEALKTKKYKTFIYSSAIALAIFLPNLFMVTGDIGEVEDTEKFFRIFRTVSRGASLGHIYIDLYLHAYVFTISAWLLTLVAYFKGKLNITNAKKIVTIINLAFLVVGIWLINVYFVHHLQVFYLYFAMRSTYIFKPLFIFLFVSIAFDLWDSVRWSSRILGIIIFASLFVPSPYLGALLALFSAIYIGSDLENLSLVKRVDEKLDSIKFLNPKKGVSKLQLAIFVMLILSGVYIFLQQHNNKLNKVYRLLQGKNVFNFTFNKEKNYGLNKSHPAFGEVLDWAKANHKGKMFIVPPDNCIFASPFRFLTKNSIYTNICDVFQLNYTPEYFYEAYNRLFELNFKVNPDGTFDYTGYNQLKLSNLAELSADFVVFDKTSEGYENRPVEPVFENDVYIIYSLK